MKDIILPILHDIHSGLEQRIPQTKKETVYVNIENVKPSDIMQFMIDNNIPDNAEFGGKPNGNDAYDEMCLCYDIDVPIHEKEKIRVREKTFDRMAFSKINESLIANGYRRTPVNSEFFKKFKDLTVYSMYINNDFDKIIKYYSYFFIKL